VHDFGTKRIIGNDVQAGGFQRFEWGGILDAQKAPG